MKYLKTYKQVQESKLQDLALGVGLGAATLTSCEKPGYEYEIKFGSKTGTVVDNNTPGSQTDYIGKKAYVVTKADLSTNHQTSPQWVFSEKPTPEQLAIIASYHNFESEERNSYNKNPQVGDNVVFYDLEDVEIKLKPIENVTSEQPVTKSGYYSTAYNWCKDNSEIFQKDLDQLSSSTTKPDGPIGELTNFNATSILDNKENKPK